MKKLDSKTRQVIEALALNTPRRVPVPNKHTAQLWHVLQALKPAETRMSLHIIELQYKIGERRYSVYFNIGESSPSDIDFVQV